MIEVEPNRWTRNNKDKEATQAHVVNKKMEPRAQGEGKGTIRGDASKTREEAWSTRSSWA